MYEHSGVNLSLWGWQYAAADGTRGQQYRCMRARASAATFGGTQEALLQAGEQSAHNPARVSPPSLLPPRRLPRLLLRVHLQAAGQPHFTAMTLFQQPQAQACPQHGLASQHSATGAGEASHTKATKATPCTARHPGSMDSGHSVPPRWRHLGATSPGPPAPAARAGAACRPLTGRAARTCAAAAAPPPLWGGKRIQCRGATDR
jgi:hypothetical protein